MSMRKIGVLTSGGDAPGMNACVVSVARSAASFGMPLVGIKRGYNGLLRKSTNVRDDLMEMQLDTLLDIEDLPGTFLRTARCREFYEPYWRDFAVKTLQAMEIDGLVIIGGDGSFQGAMRLCELGIPCIGIPGTIDNDLPYTEITLGFPTAVQVCTDAVRAVRATSRSHDRPAIVEVMGRHSGEIALKTACATGAEILLVPEVEWSIEETAERLSTQIARGNTRATILLAEGCWDSMQPFDYYTYLKENGGACYEGQPIDSHILGRVLRTMCKCEARTTVVGYTQRGVIPVAGDSAFAFEAGHMAVELLHEGMSNQVIGVGRGQVFYMPMEAALKQKRKFRKDLFDLVNKR